MLYNTCMQMVMKVSLSILQIETLIVSVLAVSILVTICIIFGLMRHSETVNKKNIKDLTNKSRMYLIDVKNDKVSYFSASNLKERKSSSITVFYNLYQSKEREKLITWVGALLDKNSDTPKYLEVKIYSKKSKHHLPIMLEVEKIDYDKQIIFMESHILQNELIARRHGTRLAFSKRDILYKRILMSNGKGVTCFFNLFNKVTKDSDISQLVYADLKDIILSFISDDVMMVEEKLGQIIITNFNIKEKSEVLNFINEIKIKINRYLLIKSYSNDISLSIGIIDNSESFRDVNALIKNVISLSNICKDSDEQIAFYSESKMLLTEESENEYRSDVQSIIEDNKLKYFFQPIVSVDNSKVFAYKSSVQPIDSFFEELENLKIYAKRTDDDKELFSTITKNVISRFSQEKYEYNQKLFFPLSFNELDYATRTLSHTPGANTVDIVLVLYEKDLSNLPDDYDDEALNKLILSFKTKGYSVALEIDDDILTLSPSLYSVFDYFILSVASHMSKNNTGSDLPTFQGLIEKLLHYEKPLVALDIKTWDTVELVYHLGISNICADAISEKAENIMPLPKKMLTKIINLKS